MRLSVMSFLQDIPRGPSGNGSRETVPICSGGDDGRRINAQLVGCPNSSQTVDADLGVGVDVEDLGLAVELIRRAAHGTVIVVEETVQPCTEDGDIAGFGYMQSPGGGLVGIKRWILPFWESGEERSGGRWVRLEVGSLCLWKAEVVICSPGEVVINDDVVLGPSSDEPNGTLRFRQKATTRVDGRLVTEQGLDIVVGEPDPGSFEVSIGFAGKVDGQKRGEALGVSDVGRRALGQLELGSSCTSEADV